MVIFSASLFKGNETEPWERMGLAHVTCEAASFLAVGEINKRHPITRLAVCPKQRQH